MTDIPKWGSIVFNIPSKMTYRTKTGKEKETKPTTATGNIATRNGIKAIRINLTDRIIARRTVQTDHEKKIEGPKWVKKEEYEDENLKQINNLLKSGHKIIGERWNFFPNDKLPVYGFFKFDNNAEVYPSYDQLNELKQIFKKYGYKTTVDDWIKDQAKKIETDEKLKQPKKIEDEIQLPRYDEVNHKPLSHRKLVHSNASNVASDKSFLNYLKKLKNENFKGDKRIQLEPNDENKMGRYFISATKSKFRYGENLGGTNTFMDYPDNREVYNRYLKHYGGEAFDRLNKYYKNYLKNLEKEREEKKKREEWQYKYDNEPEFRERQKKFKKWQMANSEILL